MTALLEASEKFKRWFVDDALPLWAAQGYDHDRGGFYEALNFDGTPSVNRPRRVRVQARQIHTFSQAGIRGWHDGAEALAARGFDHFLEKACPDGGARGCVHLIGDNGEILDAKRDLYDQAFLLLACASRWRAAKDQRALTLADKTIEFLDRELASPHGGWLESDQRELPRRQNPHMHLFEAFMALYRATGEDRYFSYSAKIMTECFPTFYDAANGIIVELFNEDLGKREKADIIEPGHMLEWVWLLANWEAVADSSFREVRNRLFISGAGYGEDTKFYGFIKNRVDTADSRARSAKRLWPQLEYLKACCVQGEEADENAHLRAAALIADIFTTYLNVEKAGLWIDEFDAKGAPIARDVPASILYHLFEAVAETETLNASKGAP